MIYLKDNRLNENKIGSAKVHVDIVPKGKCIPNVKITPTSITIHNTGNVGASALANHNYMKSINKTGSRIASWHFTVDDINIYQAQSCNYKCYHAGNNQGNNTSIGIEICMFNDKNRQLKAYKNAIELVKVLMDYYSFNINQVKRHYDWSKKNCPQWLIEGKYGYTWQWFKNQITINVPNETFKVKVNTEVLNIRAGAGTQYKVVGTVQKGEVFTIVAVDGKWGQLKSGVGWIHLGYTMEVD